MKKSLSAVMATFLSLTMLSACNTQGRNVTTDQNGKVGYQPVRYNPYRQMNDDNMTRDGRFITIFPDGGQYQQYGYGPDLNFDQRAFPNPNFNQNTVPGNNQFQNNLNNTARNQNQYNPPPPTNKQTNIVPPKDQAISEFQSKVIQLTNQQRQKNGLPALKADPQVSKVAQTKADDMASNNYFSHTSPKYGSPFTMLKDFGVDYRTAAENIAQGQTTPEQVVNSWMNSAGHRANILSSQVTNIGVGYSKNGNYWSQMFIGK